MVVKSFQCFKHSHLLNGKVMLCIELLHLDLPGYHSPSACLRMPMTKRKSALLPPVVSSRVRILPQPQEVVQGSAVRNLSYVKVNIVGNVDFNIAYNVDLNNCSNIGCTICCFWL